jgi:hypothetical protein
MTLISFFLALDRRWDIADKWVAGKTVLDFKQNQMDSEKLMKSAATGLEGMDMALAEEMFEIGQVYCLRLMVKRPSSDWGKIRMLAYRLHRIIRESVTSIRAHQTRDTLDSLFICSPFRKD